jgi:hypothetical protein
MERIDIPASFSGGQKTAVNNLGVVRVDYADDYFYDQHGLIGVGTPNTTYTLAELANIPPEWTNVIIHDMTDDDLEIVGRASNDLGDYRAFYVDLATIDPATGKAEFQLLPTNGSSRSGARGINNAGDIAVQFELPDGSWSVYLTHRDNLSAVMPLNFEVANSQVFKLNNRISDPVTHGTLRQAQLLFELPSGDLAHYTIGDPVSAILNLTEAAGEHLTGNDLVDIGDVWGRINRQEEVPGRRGRTNIVDVQVGMSFQYPFDSLPNEIVGIRETRAANNSADFVGDSVDGSIVAIRNGITYNISDLIMGPSDELNFWLARSEQKVYDINERDSTGFGQILVSASLITTTGRGRNQTQITERRLYLLTPVLQ